MGTLSVKGTAYIPFSGLPLPEGEAVPLICVVPDPPVCARPDGTPISEAANTFFLSCFWLMPPNMLSSLLPDLLSALGEVAFFSLWSGTGGGKLDGGVDLPGG